jgi:hypothetical protein
MEKLDAVTQREVAAVRMAPDDELRELAEAAVFAPHYSHVELVAMEEEKRRAEQTPAITGTVGGWRHRVLTWLGRR